MAEPAGYPPSTPFYDLPHQSVKEVRYESIDLRRQPIERRRIPPPDTERNGETAPACARPHQRIREIVDRRHPVVRHCVRGHRPCSISARRLGRPAIHRRGFAHPQPPTRMAGREASSGRATGRLPSHTARKAGSSHRRRARNSSVMAISISPNSIT